MQNEQDDQIKKRTAHELDLLLHARSGLTALNGLRARGEVAGARPKQLTEILEGIRSSLEQLEYFIVTRPGS